MERQAFRKVRFALSLTVIAAAITAFAAVGSAAAATQHWATATPATQIAEGSNQSFTGKNQGSVQLNWKYAGTTVVLNCSQMSTAGTASNPAGGGSGILSGTSLELAGCTVNLPSCKVVNGAIPFESLKGYARIEAGDERVRFEPSTGTTMALVKFANSNGESCPLGSSIAMTGYFEAISVPSQAGQYRVSGTSHLKLGSEVEMLAEMSLTATSGKQLALSSAGSPGVPHWYLGGSAWTALPAGESASYSSGAVPLTLNTKIGLAKVEISGCQGLNAGSVENPAGGGAGTASSTYTPGWMSACQINVASCGIESAESIELSGKATEVGLVPAVEWSPKSGSAVMVFRLRKTGSEPCALGSSITVTGKLIATSKGDGRFNLAASELKVGTQTATASGEFSLETQLGKSLRLQP